VKNGWKTREQMEATERATLAPFAQKSGDSRVRTLRTPEGEIGSEDLLSVATVYCRAFTILKCNTSESPLGVGRLLGKTLRDQRTKSPGALLSLQRSTP